MKTLLNLLLTWFVSRMAMTKNHRQCMTINRMFGSAGQRLLSTLFLRSDSSTFSTAAAVLLVLHGCTGGGFLLRRTQVSDALLQAASSTSRVRTCHAKTAACLPSCTCAGCLASGPAGRATGTRVGTVNGLTRHPTPQGWQTVSRPPLCGVLTPHSLLLTCARQVEGAKLLSIGVSVPQSICTRSAHP